MKVSAVVVTYNRKNMLLECLAGLLNQTRNVDEIILVNNASTDGTDELLKESGYLDNPLIHYCKLESNTGGAGGFSYGMKVAIERGADWVWTMDDDIEPEPETLEVQLSYTELSECINATKVFTENGETQYWEQFYDPFTARLFDMKNRAFENGREWCCVNVACFEGMLVSAKLIEKIGFPEQDYFIYQDDTVYGIKASFYTNVLYVKPAVFRKKIYGYGNMNPFRVYYTLRNNFKVKRDISQMEQIGSGDRLSNFIFLLSQLKVTFQGLRFDFSFNMIKSILKGWLHGFQGK
ncbi:glycosyltransferase family 2 protein [Vibrio sp. M250220]|uniref:glycosyltransferase family 2 protein n=1 Tax=Vibrio sp. M250220 TaxID=3020894 RepID=UPI002F3E74A1